MTGKPEDGAPFLPGPTFAAPFHLAGDPAGGIAADFPDQVGYGVGAELSVTPRVTLSVERIVASRR